MTKGYNTSMKAACCEPNLLHAVARDTKIPKFFDVATFSNKCHICLQATSN